MLRNLLPELEWRYALASQYVSKTVLDFGKLTIFEYNGSKILLENEVLKVIKCNENNGVNRYTTRVMTEDKSISLDEINYNSENNNLKFDSILSFESMNNKEYFRNVIERFYPKLEKNGIFVISAFNKELLVDVELNDENEEMGITLLEFEELLKNKFNTYQIFSQRLLTESDIDKIKKSNINVFSAETPIQTDTIDASKIKNIRKKLAKSFQLIDKSGNLYKKYFSTTIKKVEKKFEEEFDEFEYKPVLYEKNHTPMFFVVVCKK